MQQRRSFVARIAGFTLLATGLAWLAWVCFLGFALRDGITQHATVASRGALQVFVADAWHMLVPGVLLVLTGLLVLWRTGRHT